MNSIAGRFCLLRSFHVNRGVLPLILLTALAVRLGFALSLGSRVVQPDEGVYLNLARNLHEKRVFGLEGVPTADRPPALPFLVAAVYEVAGPRIPAARVMNALLGALAVWLIHGFASAAFGRREGLIAAAVAAVYPFFVYWSGVVMTETLTVCLVLGACWASDRLLKSPSARLAAAAGLLWGLAALTRTQNLAFPFLAAPWLLRGPEKRARALAAAAFLAAAAAPAALWSARNKAVLGSGSLDTHSGYTLIIRTMFYDQDNVDTSVAAEALARTEIYREAMKLPPDERDRAFMRASLRFIRDNPLTYLRNCGRNFVQLWRFYPRLDKTVYEKGPFLGGGRGRFAFLSLLTEPALIALGAAGLWLAASRGLPVFLPALFIAYTTAVHSLVIAQMRYRLPMMPFVIIFAAVSLVHISERIRNS